MATGRLNIEVTTVGGHYTPAPKYEYSFDGMSEYLIEMGITLHEHIAAIGMGAEFFMEKARAGIARRSPVILDSLGFPAYEFDMSMSATEGKHTNYTRDNKHLVTASDWNEAVNNFIYLNDPLETCPYCDQDTTPIETLPGNRHCPSCKGFR